MSLGISANKLELLQIAEAVAREKSIEKEIVIEAMEEAIQKGARARYGAEHDVRVHIDPKTGETTIKRVLTVVDDDASWDVEAGEEEPAGIIRLSDAKRTDKDAVVGKTYEEVLPPFEFGRVQTQMARQVITGKVREAERERQFAEYKDRMGEIVNGIIKRVEYGNVTVDLGKAEAILRRDEIIPREHFKRGDRVRAFIFDVRREQRGPQIFLSRTHPDFMKKLFSQEVPEGYDGVIEIKRAARDPGSRAKIAVLSHDSSIDPVGACVGMRGSRVQAVVAELQGEKIDIIPWSADNATFVVNALAPAEVTKVVLDEEDNKIEVVVPDDQLSLAIGRRGQNVRLASILTGFDIDILTEEQESQKREAEAKSLADRFETALDVDEVIARLLVTEGFTEVEEVAYVPIDELAGIEGFDQDIGEELQRRARDFLEAEAERLSARRIELGVEDDVAAIDGLTPQMLVLLGEEGIKSLEDFAGLAADELTSPVDGILKDQPLSEPDAVRMITHARVAMGWMTEDEMRAALADPSAEVAEESEPASS